MTPARAADRDDVSTLQTMELDGELVRYVSEYYRGGSMCDLTQQPRQTEVRYVCFPSATVLSHVREVLSCEYVIVVGTPLLCRIAAMHTSERTTHDAVCQRMLDKGATQPAAGRDASPAAMPGRASRLSLYGRSWAEAFQKRWAAERKTAAAAQSSAPPPAGQGAQAQTQTQTRERPAAETKPTAAAALTLAAARLLLLDGCVRSGSVGWWSYEFCFGRHVKQLHEEPRAGAGGATWRIENLLGQWDVAAHERWYQSLGTARQAALRADARSTTILFFGSGDFCAAIKAPRSALVVLQCGRDAVQPTAIAVTVDETTTCAYTLTIASPALCVLLESAEISASGVPHW